MRALRISLIVIVVLGLLFVAADRVALYLAQDEVAAKVQSSLDLPEEPEVSVRGFPFLTQLAGKNLRQVDLGVTGFEASVDGEKTIVDQLDLKLRDVELTNGYSDAVARHAEGSGLITYEELTRAYGELFAVSDSGLGFTFGYAGDGQVSLSLEANVLGQNIELQDMSGTIFLDGGNVWLDIEEIPDLPEIPGVPDPNAMIREQVGTQRAIGGLPDGLALAGVTATKDGVALEITGSDVGLNGASAS